MRPSGKLLVLLAVVLVSTAVVVFGKPNRSEGYNPEAEAFFNKQQFETRAEFEKYWYTTVQVIADDIYAFYFSDLRLDSQYPDLNNMTVRGGRTLAIDVYQGLIPFTREVEAKLRPYVQGDSPPRCNGNYFADTRRLNCRSIEKNPPPMDQSIDAWLRLCSEWEDVVVLWHDSILPTQKKLSECKLDKDPDYTFKLQLGSNSLPKASELAGGFWNKNIVLNDTVLGARAITGFELMAGMIASYGGNQLLNPCTRAIMNLRYGSGNLTEPKTATFYNDYRDTAQYWHFPDPVPPVVCMYLSQFGVKPEKPEIEYMSEVENFGVMKKHCHVMTPITPFPQPDWVAPGIWNIAYMTFKASEVSKEALDEVDAELEACQGPKEESPEEVLAKGSAIALPLPHSDISGPQLIGRWIRRILSIIGGLTLALLIYGGVRWMTAAGNEESIKQARGIIVWSILGLVAIFAAYAIVNFVITALT